LKSHVKGIKLPNFTLECIDIRQVEKIIGSHLGPGRSHFCGKYLLEVVSGEKGFTACSPIKADISGKIKEM
jgi:hypothetical protein